MGRYLLSLLAKMTLLARARAFAAHPDPATATANFVALLIAWNTPFYPLYVVWLIGTASAGLVSLTALSTPFFLAIPILSRWSPSMARLALPVFGMLNTLWCTKLEGPASGIGIFFLPCIVVAALLYRRSERRLLLSAALLPLAAYFVPDAAFRPPIISLDPAQSARLIALNAGSVAMLMAVLAYRFAGLLRRFHDD